MASHASKCHALLCYVPAATADSFISKLPTTPVNVLLSAAEIKDYNFNNPPQSWADNTAHFTQVSW
jgi:hypothetical protein